MTPASSLLSVDSRGQGRVGQNPLLAKTDWIGRRFTSTRHVMDSSSSTKMSTRREVAKRVVDEDVGATG
jgi:hypothetical protein